MARSMAAVVISLLALSGCFRAGSAPMGSVQYRVSAGAPAKCVVVFLPGLFDPVQAFEREGFIDELRAAGVEADAIAVDAHLGYYRAENLHERLRADVLEPARAAGAERFFFVGASMGGFGALVHASKFGADVDGLLVLSPYLGPAEVQREVAAAGGPHAWRSTDTEPFRVFWQWLVGYLDPALSRPALFLGFGRRERGFASFLMFTALVKPTHTFVVNGAHGWGIWRPLWSSFLKLHGDSICAS